MYSRKLLLGLTGTAVLLAGAASAGEIYRYTDENGNVVYVDRPADDAPVERMNIQSRPTNPTAIQARVAERAAATETAEERRQARAEAKKAEEAEKAAAQERADRCQIARNRMETLVTSRQLFRQDENGERDYLEEDEIMEARAKVQAQIEETCD